MLSLPAFLRLPPYCPKSKPTLLRSPKFHTRLPFPFFFPSRNISPRPYDSQKTTTRFELFSGSQLHIDIDDDFSQVTHHRIGFRSYESLFRDQGFEATFRSWPKPLTIEFLEEQFQNKWLGDLSSPCWEDREVRELGSVAGGAGGAGPGAGGAAGVGGANPVSRQAHHHDGGPDVGAAGSGGSNRGGGIAGAGAHDGSKRASGSGSDR